MAASSAGSMREPTPMPTRQIVVLMITRLAEPSEWELSAQGHFSTAWQWGIGKAGHPRHPQ
jgi:hypothetical protein